MYFWYLVFIFEIHGFIVLDEVSVSVNSLHDDITILASNSHKKKMYVHAHIIVYTAETAKYLAY